jgi:ribosomal protein S18 acetylase RimI-like enzyme
MLASGTQTGLSYFKRFRMEIDLNDLPHRQRLPEGFSWVTWDPYLVEPHAEILYGCFFEEIDATVFPSLGSRSGCQALMTEIVRKTGFLPQATWLLTGPEGHVGSVQGVRERSGLGAIQNLGILPAFRGQGLGRALLLQSLHGFFEEGLGRAYLEVTAQNDGAVRLYHRVGFRRRKTVYKTVEVSGVYF